MFVRNNTNCPNCGRITAYDVYLKFEGLNNRDPLTFVIECHNCLRFKDVSVDLTVVRMWLKVLADAAGSSLDDALLVPRRWSSDCYFVLTKSQRKTTVRLAQLWFSQGTCCSETVELPQFRKLLRTLETSGGTVPGSGPGELINAWCGL